MDQNISEHFTSISTIKKSNEIDAKEIIEYISSSTETTKTLDSKSLLAGIEPIGKTEMENNFMDLLHKTMIVNNKVANKSISLPEQKIINTSNYEIVDATRHIDETSKIQYKKMYEVDQQYFNEVIKAGFISKPSDTKTEVPVEGTTIQVNQVNTESVEWLKKILDLYKNKNDGFLFNFDLHRNGTTEQAKPMYGKYDAVSLSKISSTYISKLRNTNKFKGGQNYSNSNVPKDMDDFRNMLKNSIKSGLSGSNAILKKNERRNPFVEDLLAAGPDLYSNMFDVYLRFNKKSSGNSSNGQKVDEGFSSYSYVYFLPVISVKNGGAVINTETHALKSTFEDVYSLSVRTASVDVPMINRSTTSLPLLNTKVERPTGSIDYDLQGTLSIDCDANTYVHDMFMSLSGLQRDGYFKNNTETALKPIKDELYDHILHFPFMAPARTGFHNTSIDLVVSSHSLAAYSNKNVNPSAGGFFSNILYVFKDVRFLGCNDIKFSNESDSSSSVDVGFIAKNLETYYKPDNVIFGTNTGINKSKVFNTRHLNGMVYDESSIIEDDSLSEE